MLFSPDEATLFLGILYQQFRELASPVPVDSVDLPQSQMTLLKGSARNKCLTLMDTQVCSCPSNKWENITPSQSVWKQKEKLFPDDKGSNQHSAPHRWLLPILLLPQRPVQKWRSELLLFWERGPWEEDGNVTPARRLLYLNDSLRDVSQPTLVKDPDPLILLFFSCQ